jgi:phenylpropionate dioxygenase-like ring-hydroxylating dioxygenase large terminal subunit
MRHCSATAQPLDARPTDANNMQMHISSLPADAAADLVREGAVHRAVYTDPAVFALEQARIFGRAWVYVGHESEVRAPGDWLLTRLGADEVILARTDEGGLALLHNQCAHRGANVVSCERGHSRHLRCPYHAWTYRLDGRLVGVPMASGYPSDFCAGAERGLASVARVASYRGFVFGSRAATGPDLPEFLGELASALDNMVDRAPAGTLTAVPGRLRMQYRGNWKLFMENATDLVHPGFVHASSVTAARGLPATLDADAASAQTAQMLLSNGLTVPEWDQVPLRAASNGHVHMGGFYRSGSIAPTRTDPVYERYRAALVARHGEARTAEILALDRFNNLIWPTLSVNARFATLRIVQPVAVDRTIVQAACFRFDGAPEEMFDLTLQFLNTGASAASLVASDDLEIFERCQRGLAQGGHDWIDVSRGLSADRADGHGVTGSGTSELSIRNQLAAWRRWMSEPA